MARPARGPGATAAGASATAAATATGATAAGIAAAGAAAATADAFAAPGAFDKASAAATAGHPSLTGEISSSLSLGSRVRLSELPWLPVPLAALPVTPV